MPLNGHTEFSSRWMGRLQQVYHRYLKQQWKIWLELYPFLTMVHESNSLNTPNGLYESYEAHQFKLQYKIQENSILNVAVIPTLCPDQFDFLQFQQEFFQNSDFVFFLHLFQWIGNPVAPITISYESKEQPNRVSYLLSHFEPTMFYLDLFRCFSFDKTLNSSQKHLPSAHELRDYYTFHLDHPPSISWYVRSAEASNGHMYSTLQEYLFRHEMNLKSNSKTKRFYQHVHGKYYTARPIAHYMLEHVFISPFQTLIERIKNSIDEFIQIISSCTKRVDLSSHALPSIVSTFLSDILQFLSFTVIDPACGAGVFLRSIIQELLPFREELMSYLSPLLDYRIEMEAIMDKTYLFRFLELLTALQSQSMWVLYLFRYVIFGVDIDPIALLICRGLLWYEFLAPISCSSTIPLSLICPNFRWANALLFLPSLTEHPLDPPSKKIFSELSNTIHLFPPFQQFSCYSPHIENLISFSDQYHNYVIDSQEKILQASQKLSIFDPSFIIQSNFRPINWQEAFYSFNSQPFRGFSLMISNPPWEMHQRNDREFFGQLIPDIVTLPRSQMYHYFHELENLFPWIAYSYQQFRDTIKITHDWWQQTFHLQQVQKYNLYKLFLELSFILIHQFQKLSSNSLGGCSFIIPAGLLGEARASALRAYLIENRFIYRITQLYSSEEIFPSIVSGQPLCILEFTSTSSSSQSSIIYRGNIQSISALIDSSEGIPIPLSFLKQFSPHFSASIYANTPSYTIPFLSSSKDFHLLSQMLQFPKLGLGWGLDAHRELNRTDDLKSGVISTTPTILPVLEGKFLVRFGFSLKTARYFVQDPVSCLRQKTILHDSRIVWRNVSNINLARRMFVCVIPAHVATVNSLNYLCKDPNLHSSSQVYPSLDNLTKHYLTAILGSIVAEYFLRFLSSNNNLNQYVVLNLPIPLFDPQNSLHRHIATFLQKQTPVFNSWANQMVIIPHQHLAKRQLEREHWELLAHLDACVVLLYHLSVDDISILKTKFPNLPSVYFNLVQKEVLILLDSKDDLFT